MAQRATPIRKIKTVPAPLDIAAATEAHAEPFSLDDIDRLRHAVQARLTGGISPAALMEASADWLIHLGNAPARRWRLLEKAYHNAAHFLWDGNYLGPREDLCQLNDRLCQDRRFADPDWSVWPFNALALAFLLVESWWDDATIGTKGVTAQHEREVNFMVRQVLDRFAPSNFFWTNPEVLRTTWQSAGLNLAHGWLNLLEDLGQVLSGGAVDAESAFHVGKNIAVTPGKVIFRNHLIELIQYTPVTPRVSAEPILIVPAWIMKYYILDLAPHDSLVRYLVGQGHTVFMISWHNPGAEDRDLGLDDYRALGIMAALDAVNAVIPERKIHACGYCLGGTLLAIAAAAMAARGDDRLASITLLAAQTDFSEAGELMLYINESQIAWIEDMMWAQGGLDPGQMSGAFQMLRSNDLIWSRLVRHYWLGKPTRLTDLMTWNADATRMPYRMHAEYLRHLFLKNRLARGSYEVEGKPVALHDIRAPIFAVGTMRDHIAPWKSVFKIHMLTESDVTFVLTEGGHNAGIVSEPGHADRHFLLLKRHANDPYIDPERWTKAATRQENSWWPAWSAWLKNLSSGDSAPPPMGTAAGAYRPLMDAPGKYVYEK